MSNLIKGGNKSTAQTFLKGGYVTMAPEGKVTINGNIFVEKRLEELRARMKQAEPAEVQEGFSEGLDPFLVEKLVADPEEGSSVIKSGQSAAREEIDAMLAQAREEAEQIVARAGEEAAQIRSQAREAGRQEGYREGRAAAEEECRAAYAEKEKQCEQRTAAAEQDYRRRQEELEPLLVDKISEIFAHVTGARLEDDRRTVLFLLNRALGGAESGRHYIIHVSAADFETVRENRAEVAKGTGILPESFEIVEDAALEAGGCLIESDGGIWDCSLGTQLKLLVQQLKILSYE